MKDLQKLAKRAMEELDAIGVPYRTVDSFTVNTRAKKRWGQCCSEGYGHFSINISVRLLQDDVTDESVLDTLIHELIHTCEGCMNHGAEWLKWAELVNDCYACYNIKRCASSEEKGVKYEPRERNYNWIFTCPKCEQHWYYQRQPQWAKEYDPIKKEMTNGSCPYCHKNVILVKGNKAKLQHTYSF